MSSWNLNTDEGHAEMAKDIAASNPAAAASSALSAQHVAPANSAVKNVAKASSAPIVHPPVSAILAANPGYIKLAYFDASAIVKLLLRDGSATSVQDASSVFYESGVVINTTMICFAETLQVLKRKRFFPKNGDVQLTDVQYSGAVMSLYCMVNSGPMRMDSAAMGWDLMMETDDLVRKHGVDHSDALQIATIKSLNGGVWNLGTFLCTADKKLADAAAVESIPVAYLR